MILVATVQLAYTVQYLVVTQVRPCICMLSFCILNAYLGTKLSFVMSEYYEANNRNPQACSFSGNGTVNPLASSSVSASAVASSCISNAAAVFTPSAPTTTGGGSSSTSSGHTGGSVSLVGSLDAIVGMSVMAIIGVMTAVWTLV
jgi:1,3-beta-glucanosyltransferase GAS1